MMENKERLEEIEKLAVMIMSTECEEEYDSLVNVFILNHLERLIRYAKEQAEQVQELERVNKEMYWTASDFKFENLKLEQQNKRYRETLEFYADENNWEGKNNGLGNAMTDYEPEICFDIGIKARKALEADTQ